MPDDIQRRLAAAQQTVKSAVPDLPDTPFEAMGPVDKLLKLLRGDPGVQAFQHKKQIRYDPAAIQGLSDPQLQDLVVHELTHAKNAQQGLPDSEDSASGLGDAYQAEKDYQLKTGRSQAGDITLPGVARRPLQ